MIASLAGSSFRGTVHGYEINERAAAIARQRIADTRLHNSYEVRRSKSFGCF